MARRPEERKPEDSSSRSMGEGRDAATRGDGGASSPNASRMMLVANPAAGSGQLLKVSDRLLMTMRDLGFDFDFKLTEGPGHAVQIARAAGLAGYGTIVSAGGDGTFSETVNGVMSLEKDLRPRLGIIPLGHGCDICRTLRIPTDWITAASFLASEKKRRIDVGRMEYVSGEGPVTGYFTNTAGLGFDGEVARRAAGLPGRLATALGGTGTHFLSMLATYARFRGCEVELHVDGDVHHMLVATCIVANCRYFAGRMLVAPDAECDDGLFDVVVVGAGYGTPELAEPVGTAPARRPLLGRTAARLRMARNLPAVYRGTHVDDRSVVVLRGGKVKVVPVPRMAVQADGEVVGEGPLTAEIVQGAIEVIA